MALNYSILDPTGNITALVESPVAVERQPSVAADIMRRHAKVEQVGFVRSGSEASADIELRMAGGEFCGNATMSAAALYLARRDQDGSAAAAGCDGKGEVSVWLRVSGATDLVEVRLQSKGPESFAARVHMPQATGIAMTELTYRQMQGRLPVVLMEGISHVVVPANSVLFALRKDPSAAEQAVCAWCEAFEADGLGLMFLEGEGSIRRLTPLVYVPGSDTVFWENSCASGSAAVGMYMADETGGPVALTLHEPGGKLQVTSEPLYRDTWLQGAVCLVGHYELEQAIP